MSQKRIFADSAEAKRQEEYFAQIFEDCNFDDKRLLVRKIKICSCSVCKDSVLRTGRRQSKSAYDTTSVFFDVHMKDGKFYFAGLIQPRTMPISCKEFFKYLDPINIEE